MPYIGDFDQSSDHQDLGAVIVVINNDDLFLDMILISRIGIQA